jgi:diacylglycerol kinase
MKLIKSFGHAWHGIQYCYKSQLNFRIHLFSLLIVTIAGFVVNVSNTEWLFIVGCSTLVLALELMNTGIEHLCDMISTEIHPTVKVIKDVSAAAVLVAAAGSVVTGVIIFLPKIFEFYKIKQ